MTHHAWGPSITVQGRCAEGIIMQETELKLELSRSGAGTLPEEKSVWILAYHSSAEILVTCALRVPTCSAR
jgi:hypothetical protein